jgi:hypothetical protein
MNIPEIDNHQTYGARLKGLLDHQLQASSTTAA